MVFLYRTNDARGIRSTSAEKRSEAYRSSSETKCPAVAPIKTAAIRISDSMKIRTPLLCSNPPCGILRTSVINSPLHMRGSSVFHETNQVAHRLVHMDRHFNGHTLV